MALEIPLKKRTYAKRVFSSIGPSTWNELRNDLTFLNTTTYLPIALKIPISALLILIRWCLLFSIVSIHTFKIVKKMQTRQI